MYGSSRRAALASRFATGLTCNGRLLVLLDRADTKAASREEPKVVVAPFDREVRKYCEADDQNSKSDRPPRA